MPLKSVLLISVSPAYEIGAYFFYAEKGGFSLKWQKATR